jgi:hypothetical protein
MAVHLRAAVDQHIADLITYGADGDPAQELVDEIISGTVQPSPTWKAIGKAVGVSALAAHRKHGHHDQAASR